MTDPTAGRRWLVPAVLVGGALLLTVVALVSAVLVTGLTQAGPDGEDTDVFSLQVGHCVNGVRDTGREAAEFATTPVVPCSQPHEAEVITSFEVDDEGDYPGEEAVVARSEERCVELLARLLPAREASEVVPFYFYPTAESWERAGDRTVLCLAMPSSGSTTGSLLDP